LHGIEHPNSLVTLYEYVTSSLGVKPTRRECKIVGLASYGDPGILGPILFSRIDQTDGDFKIFEANNVYFSRYLSTYFQKLMWRLFTNMYLESPQKVKKLTPQIK
jgi:carbamoyltransferase